MEGTAAAGAAQPTSARTSEAAGTTSRRNKESRFSAFVAPATWGQQGTAVGDDLSFWLGEELGPVRGSTVDLRVRWLALDPSNSALYVYEVEDTEALSQRLSTGVVLEKDGAGFRLPPAERARLMGDLEEFRERGRVEEEEGTHRQSAEEVRDECDICGKDDSASDDQVLCDRCNRGFHLDCLTKEGIAFNDDVLEDGVKWLCRECVLAQGEAASLVYDKERLAVQDTEARMSRKGRQIRRPAKFLH